MKRLFLYLSLAVALSACADRQEYVRPPLMGWNSWNAYMVDISDSIIMNAADMMIAKGLKDAGYDARISYECGFKPDFETAVANAKSLTDAFRAVWAE